MDKKIELFIEKEIEKFRKELADKISEMAGSDQSVEVVTSFRLSMLPRIRVVSAVSTPLRVDVKGGDPSRVPVYNWHRNEKIYCIDEPITADMIAAALERLEHRGPTARRLKEVLVTFYAQGWAHVNRAQLKEMGCRDTDVYAFKQDLRYTGLPFTLSLIEGVVESGEPCYKFSVVAPPRSFRK